MSHDPLVPVPPSALRRTARSVVPFRVRAGVIRLPHVLRWLRGHEEPERIEPDGELVCERSSPLCRTGTAYDPVLQAAKETNVRRAAQAFDRLRLPPGATLSWHGIVGPPLSVRGFAPGPELHDEKLARGSGGGACQVANLLFWLGANAGLTVVERHRHGLDLFADDHRHVPFGCGATVFYPHRDLKLANPHEVGIRLSVQVHDGRLVGRLYAEGPLGARWELVERNHRFFRQGGAVWRANTIVRRRITPAGTTESPLVDNLARVTYPVPSSELSARQEP